jgi:hypothetical protein
MERVMAIKLRNTLRRPFEATEYHDIVCAARNVCKCGRAAVVLSNGKTSTRVLPRGFRIDGLSTSCELDDEVVRIPQVKDALADGWLVKLALEEPTPAPRAVVATGKTPSKKREE